MTPEMALSNIRHTAKTLPASVGHYHRSNLYEAAQALEDTTKELLEALKVAADIVAEHYAATTASYLYAAIHKAEGR